MSALPEVSPLGEINMPPVAVNKGPKTESIVCRKNSLPPIQVMMVHGELTHVCKALSGFSSLRNPLMNNRSRNQRIADIATAAIGNDANPIERQPWVHHLLPYQGGNSRVAIVVDCKKHARVLKKAFLPGWPIRLFADVSEYAPYGIVPPPYTLKSITPASIYLWARGGVETFGSLWENFIKDAGVPAPALLIDFFDEGPLWAEHTSMMRLNQYQRLGYPTFEVSYHQSRETRRPLSWQCRHRNGEQK